MAFLLTKLDVTPLVQWCDNIDSVKASIGDCEWELRVNGLGHYDWLRSDELNVVGVRVWPYADLSPSNIMALTAAFENIPRVFSDPEGRNIEYLFCSESSNYDDQYSNDQELGESGIVEDSDGKTWLYLEARFSPVSGS